MLTGEIMRIVLECKIFHRLKETCNTDLLIEVKILLEATAHGPNLTLKMIKIAFLLK